GLFANETQMAAHAAENGYGKFQDLGEAQKQLIRMEYAEKMQESAGATGQAARESEGLENVLGNLKQSWQDFLAVVGQPILAMVIPVLQGITSGLQLATEKVQGFMDKMAESGKIDEWKAKLSSVKDTLTNAFSEEGISGIIGVVAG